MDEKNYFREAETLSVYLIGKKPAEKEKKLYAMAIEKLQVILSSEEKKLWEFMLKNQWTIPCIDAVLAVKEPSGNIRKKLFLMLAILEASPRYWQHFLPQKRSPLYLLKIFFVGVGAMIRRITGILLLKLI